MDSNRRRASSKGRKLAFDDERDEEIDPQSAGRFQAGLRVRARRPARGRATNSSTKAFVAFSGSCRRGNEVARPSSRSALMSDCRSRFRPP